MSAERLAIDVDEPEMYVWARRVGAEYERLSAEYQRALDERAAVILELRGRGVTAPAIADLLGTSAVNVYRVEYQERQRQERRQRA